ncbi:MAG TPA: signal peptidase I [Gaiellaceae bacterium]|nr:signal peptidase I [Gaiellaceae bacterium]
MRRALVWIGIVALVLVIAGFVLDRTFLLVSVGTDAAQSDAPAIHACNGRVVVEGLTYKIRAPRRGEMVAFHAAGTSDGRITPDAHSHQLIVVRRVVAVPGDQVVGRKGGVYVNGFRADGLTTAPFKEVSLGSDEFFVLGDNRTTSQDSRKFGPVPRDAIFGRVFLVTWPLGDFGGVPGRGTGASPGLVAC